MRHRRHRRHPVFKARLGIVAAALLALVGCAGTQEADPSGLSHEGIDLRVKMSSNIFLPPLARPVPAEKKRVYLAGTNTSSAYNANARLHPLLLSAMGERGYQVVDNPAKAHYVLLYNVLYVGKEVQDLSTVTTVASGIGGAAVAATIGRDSDVVRNAGIGGVVGTLAGAVTGHYFETRTYEIVVNVQLRERQPAPPRQLSPSETARRRIEAAIRDVNRTIKYMEVSETTETPQRARTANDDAWQIHNTQVIGFASDLRLEFEDAEPVLFRTMSREISGLFWDLDDRNQALLRP